MNNRNTKYTPFPALVEKSVELYEETTKALEGVDLDDIRSIPEVKEKLTSLVEISYIDKVLRNVNSTSVLLINQEELPENTDIEVTATVDDGVTIINNSNYIASLNTAVKKVGKDVFLKFSDIPNRHIYITITALTKVKLGGE